jgi:hypothetical protein
MNVEERRRVEKLIGHGVDIKIFQMPTDTQEATGIAVQAPM